MTTIAVKITMCDYKAPLKSERTWPMIKGSVSNRGAQRSKIDGTERMAHQIFMMKAAKLK
jgi:hypothetical protein